MGHPCHHVDRVFLVEFGLQSTTSGALVLFSIPIGVFIRAQSYHISCIPINLVSDRSIDLLWNHAKKLIISVGSSCKNLLMLIGLILKLTPAFLPLMSFETWSLPDPLQLMSLRLFINHIKADTSDIHIGAIVDARAQVIHQVLHNIRITERSSDKPTTACNGKKKSLFVVSLSNKPSHDSLGHVYEKRLPGLHMCTFIDGLYLWAKCNQADSLVPNLGSNGWPGTKPFQVAVLCHKPYGKRAPTGAFNV